MGKNLTQLKSRVAAGAASSLLLLGVGVLPAFATPGSDLIVHQDLSFSAVAELPEECVFAVDSGANYLTVVNINCTRVCLYATITTAPNGPSFQAGGCSATSVSIGFLTISNPSYWGE